MSIVKLKPNPVKTEITQEQKDTSLYAKYERKIQNGRIYRYDVLNDELEVVKPSNLKTRYIGVAQPKRIELKPNSVYVEALNKESAIDKISKGRVIAWIDENGNEVRQQQPKPDEVQHLISIGFKELYGSWQPNSIKTEGYHYEVKLQRGTDVIVFNRDTGGNYYLNGKVVARGVIMEMV